MISHHIFWSGRRGLEHLRRSASHTQQLPCWKVFSLLGKGQHTSHLWICSKLGISMSDLTVYSLSSPSWFFAKTGIHAKAPSGLPPSDCAIRNAGSSFGPCVFCEASLGGQVPCSSSQYPCHRNRLPAHRCYAIAFVVACCTLSIFERTIQAKDTMPGEYSPLYGPYLSPLNHL